jgi:hypothetical protein
MDRPAPPRTRTNTNHQRKLILGHLQTNNSLITLQARIELDVMHPAARVQELREQGHNIITHRAIIGGHRVASYVLLAGVGT